MALAKKAIVIGIDGLFPEMLLRFRSELPAMSRLMERGLFAPALSSPCADTPTNWTTIATGAWTGTHGITSFHAHLPGEPLSKSHFTFGSRLCRAEYLWQAAERQGLRSILVNYPTGWPPTVKDGIVVGGDGLTSKEWAVAHPVCYYAGETAGGREMGVPVSFSRAKGWKKLPRSGKPPLAAVLPAADRMRMGWSAAGSTVERVKDTGASRADFFALIYASGKSNYNRVRICRRRDASKPLADLKVNEWSDWVIQKLGVKGNKREAALRFKLLELSRDGTRFRLYRSVGHATSGWGYPAGIERGIIRNAVPYVEGFELGSHPYRYGWFDIEQHPDQLELACRDLSTIANYLAAKEEWDLLFVQVHGHDSPNHDFLAYLMPQHPRYTPELEARVWDVYRRTSIATDNMVGAVVDANADDETVVCVVSDHGACPTFTFVWTTGALINAGLMAYDRDANDGSFVIDWSRTKVFLTDNYIWVNAKGREPHGIVEPGREFDRVLDEAILALSAIRDPKTGRRVIALAARKEDAAWLGQWGERVGDAVYYLTPGFSDYPLPGARFKWWNSFADVTDAAANAGFAEAKRFSGLHHNYLPTARLGPASNRAILILSGPGVVKGVQAGRDVNLVDVAPTLSALLGMEPPAQSEGRILTEALAQPVRL
jgi:predicted AlkP superfamily phosphohydrolase/phosphomutase